MVGLKLLGSFLIALIAFIVFSLGAVFAGLIGPGLGKAIGVGSHIGALALLMFVIIAVTGFSLFGLVKIWTAKSESES